MRLRSIARALGVMTLAGFAGLGGWRFLTLYTGPWASFVQPTREFLSAAAAHDSTRLDRLGASQAVIRRTLEAAVQHPEQFAPVDRLRVLTGQRAGDTTRVTFFHTGCSGNVLVLTFRGSGSRARVQDISVPCSPP